MRVRNWLGWSVCAAIAMVLAVFDPALAAEDVAGIPIEKGMGFQAPVTEVAREIHKFYDFLLILITVVALFVLGLLIYIAVRFNAKANPTPSKTTHNNLIEVIWTVVPIIILGWVSLYSFPLLFLQDTIPPADITVKVIGQQWYWDYEYPDHGDFAFSATMIPDDELREGQLRLLATDNPIVVPVNKVVRLHITAGDVIHSWAIPSFGLKMDAVPGRINETWFKAEQEGTYFGQCSELCGARHAFMPIEVKVVSDAEFEKWVADMQREYGALDVDQDIQLASNAR